MTAPMAGLHELRVLVRVHEPAQPLPSPQSDQQDAMNHQQVSAAAPVCALGHRPRRIALQTMESRP
jgi:hypothetical protein